MTPTLAPRATRSITQITTAFRPPSDCGGHFPVTTSVLKYSLNSSGNFVSSPYPAFYSDPRSFPSCQPPGCDPASSTNLRFDPGVCPEQWTAYNLQVGSYDGNIFATSAVCCSSEFTPAGINRIGTIGFSEEYCAQDVTLSQTSTIDATTMVATDEPSTSDPHPTAPPGAGMRIHQAWRIAWKSSDIVSLTPPPPSLRSECSNVQIQTWIPDATGTDGGIIIGLATDCAAHPDRDQGTSHMSAGDTRLFFFLAIGMPIIGALIAGSFIWWCCVRRYKKNKRRRREPAAAAAAAAAAQAVKAMLHNEDAKNSDEKTVEHGVTRSGESTAIARSGISNETLHN